ncbi:MAG: alkaline phosphatase family protein [Solirubrobacteraceae bacterium]
MRTVLIAAASLVLAGCAGARPGASIGLPQRVLPSPGSHFALVVMENREYGDVIGGHSAPFLNGLLPRAALATDYHAIAHPSLPNYIALLAGDTLGINSDCTDCSVRGPSLLDQLEAARTRWRAYMEGLPAPCFGGADAGGYVKKHNPFLYFAGRPCTGVLPYTALARDLRERRLPPFAWISPNLCDDGHDCATRTSDRYLAGLVPSLLGGLGPHGVLAIVWDEGTSDAGCCGRARGGHVPLVLLGGGVRAGARVGSPVDHYSLLRLIEDRFGLPHMRGAACPCTPTLSGLLR